LVFNFQILKLFINSPLLLLPPTKISPISVLSHLRWAATSLRRAASFSRILLNFSRPLCFLVLFTFPVSKTMSKKTSAAGSSSSLKRCNSSKTIVAERAFDELFATYPGAEWFRKQIFQRGWDSLLYSPDTCYNPDIVHHFFQNLHEDNGSWFVEVGPNRYILDRNVISEITGIPIIAEPRNQQMPSTMNLFDFMYKISIEGEFSVDHIKFESFCHNQMLVIYWIGWNILSLTKCTSVMRDTAHILHVIQKKKESFCMVQTLLSTLTKVRKESYVLPVLVTRIWAHWGLPLSAHIDNIIPHTATQIMKRNKDKGDWTKHGQLHTRVHPSQRFTIPPDFSPAEFAQLDPFQRFTVKSLREMNSGIATLTQSFEEQQREIRNLAEQVKESNRTSRRRQD
jgi:hypothetical protein